MSATPRLQFDMDALKGLAGDKVFARGQVYHRDGQVEILALESRRVLARVAGSEDYRTVLTGGGDKIGGECSCPAFEDWGFCKHMVAAALAANAAGAESGAGDMDALSRIRGHLEAKGVSNLAQIIIDLAERDAALFRKLDLEASAAGGDDKTLESSLRKAIDNATQIRDFIEYRAAAGWAAGVDEALDTLADLATGERAGLVFALAAHSIDRLEQAIESIDDSDGYCGGLLERARDIHVAAADAARPEPLALARDLFAREMGDGYGIFEGAVALYADALGDAGLAEYRRLADEAWAALPPRLGEAPGHREPSEGYRRLAEILDFFAERDGDIEARIALRAKDLSSPGGYLQLAEFCLSQGRAKEALSHAEEGLWVFQDGRQDERILLFAVGLLTKAGRKVDAEAHLRRAFDKAPSLRLYAPLRKLGGKAGHDYAVKSLESRLAGQGRASWGYPADLLIQILMDEALFEDAWAAVSRHGASPGLKDALARSSEGAYPRKALAIYIERVDQLAGGGGDPAYTEAVALIRHMAALRSAGEQATYVADLKVRFGRRRNFMKLLES